MRKSFQRTGGNIWQPFSIETPNKKERILDAKPNHVFIGGYKEDGSKLYIDNIDMSIYRCSKDSVKSLFKWDNFESFITNEYDRLALLYDNTGKKIN